MWNVRRPVPARWHPSAMTVEEMYIPMGKNIALPMSGGMPRERAALSLGAFVWALVVWLTLCRWSRRALRQRYVYVKKCFASSPPQPASLSYLLHRQVPTTCTVSYAAAFPVASLVVAPAQMCPFYCQLNLSIPNTSLLRG